MKHTRPYPLDLPPRWRKNQRAMAARKRRAVIAKRLAGEAEWLEPVKEENPSSTQPIKE